MNATLRRIANTAESAFALALALALAPLVPARAGLTFTVTAPNGVGDVVALTNAIAQINALGNMANKNGSKVWLETGVYDLSGVTMSSGSHLNLNWHGCLLAGLGDGPGEVVLLGAGEAEKCRVIYGGGSNYGWCTISNLTVTGGYSTSDGGGIGGNSSLRLINCIVSNNYAKGSAGGGGGGICHGRAINCLIADNSSDRHGGGFWMGGGGGQDAAFFEGAWNCVFSNNVATGTGNGGAVFAGSGGKCFGCTFVGNRANYGGAISAKGGNYTWFNGKFTNFTEIADCVFRGNSVTEWGNGTAIHNYSSTQRPILPVDRCEFVGNNDNGISGYGVADGCDIRDSVFFANYRQNYIVYLCNLTRCLVEANTNNYQGLSLDFGGSDSAYTNANCLFVRNVCANSNGRVSQAKMLVNCDYIDNTIMSGANYGMTTANCKLWNCILTGNMISGVARDVRANLLNQTATLVLTNCLFTASDVAVDYPGLGNCRFVARDKFKFTDDADGGYTPGPTSPAADKALQSDWIMELVGAADFPGNRRVVHRGLDIGAFECQTYPPATMVILR